MKVTGEEHFHAMPYLPFNKNMCMDEEKSTMKISYMVNGLGKATMEYAPSVLTDETAA
jgi:hypothetical protein